MPAKSPPGIVKRINAEMTAILKSPDVIAALIEQGQEAEPGPPEMLGEVASQATVTTDPRERSFDDPPFRQHLKSSSVRSLDDL